MACQHWIGVDRRYCLLSADVRPYLIGLRCPLHTPSALLGRPESPTGPGWPAAAWSTPSPQSASAVFDNRAVASGRTRRRLNTSATQPTGERNT